MPLHTEELVTGFLDPAIVWAVDAPGLLPTGREPSTDIDYAVTVTGVKIGGALRTISYHVLAFQPSPTPDISDDSLLPPLPGISPDPNIAGRQHP